MNRLPNLLHALNAIAGFAAGGILVILVLAMIPAPRAETAALRSVHDSPAVTPSIVPRDLERRHRDALLAPDHASRSPSAPAGSTMDVTASTAIDDDSLAALIETLRGRDLELPVLEIDQGDLRDDYGDPRSGGRTHEALDILAPRGTPVIAVEDGRIASLDPSQGGGGIVVYQYDPTGEFVYYYAHLEGYADGLEEGGGVEQGDILGYVGTSGNAPPDVPHLHFGIYKTSVGYRWWKGIPINPFAVLH
ncbi:MAG: M23 family metallopeptidase [Gemmatimonadota bacterium]